MGSLTTVVFIFLLRISMAVDTMTVNQQITDGETISSAGGIFELGFFNPGNSKNRYLGIWYKNVNPRTVVWVANREIPITDSSGVLKLTHQGILVVVNGTNGILWSSNSSGSSAQNPNARLLENGNLVIRNGNDSAPGNSIWQSYDYPGDTLLPGMKFGWNRVAGLDRHLSSWKSADDPSKGDFTYGIDLSGFPQLLLKNDLAVNFRAGPWDGVRFTGLPQLTKNPISTYDFVSNENEIYFMYSVVNSSVLMRLVLTIDGYSRRFVWTEKKNEWTIFSTGQRDQCDNYELCGAYGICRIDPSTTCGCMKGFRPKYPSNWDKAEWSDGCVRNTPLDCQKGDGFVKFSGVKFPDTRNSWFNERMNLKECASLCLGNCSCTAYANSDVRGGGSGCLLWFGDLIDIREFTQNGEEFYARLAAAELAAFSSTHSSSKKKQKQVIAISVSITGIALLSLILTLYVLKKRKKQLMRKRYMMECNSGDEGPEHLESPLFGLDILLNATNNFSIENKLGEGGFGPVYKGILQEGQEIAVKKLSKTSRQGLKEFKNEVEFIAKLQHRNLVKLLGCCIHGRERMLIYEYMPNKSLDLIIFDQTRSVVLDWPKRLHIINGIARGLLYLHQDSRLRIIHRDLKAENILLDHEMSPKISDFGIAKSFGGNETAANTTRVVGTLGYMSPEYASEGLYSTKSDIFSFGVLVLEIISGKRNRGFNQPDHDLNLLGHAWTLFVENRGSEFIDASMGNTYNLPEVLSAINIGLLCVQRFPDDRPSMHSVVLMLGSEGALPRPKEPCFFTDKYMMEANSSSGTQLSAITMLEAR